MAVLCLRTNHSITGTLHGVHIRTDVLCVAYVYQPCTGQVAHIALLTVYLNTVPLVYEGVYHQRTGIAGLHYLAFGIGLSGASQLNAAFMDKTYVYFTNKSGGKGRPEYRLRESIHHHCMKFSADIY